MNNDQYSVLSEKIEHVLKVVDRIDRDLTTDREHLQEFQIRLGSVETQLAQLRDTISKMPNKVGDKVADAVEGVRQEAQALKESIKKKKVLPLMIKKSWWKIF